MAEIDVRFLHTKLLGLGQADGAAAFKGARVERGLPHLLPAFQPLLAVSKAAPAHHFGDAASSGGGAGSGGGQFEGVGRAVAFWLPLLQHACTQAVEIAARFALS